MTPDRLPDEVGEPADDAQETENKPKRGEKRPFAWLYILRWLWPLLSVIVPTCLSCFYVASGTQYRETLRLSPMRVLFNTLAGAREYFNLSSARKGSSDAFWGVLTGGSVVVILLWVVAVAFGLFLLSDHVAERYAKTAEARAQAAFRLALFAPRRWVLWLFAALRVIPFLFLIWFARVTFSKLGVGTDAIEIRFDPCPVAAAVMGLVEIGLDVAERKFC